MSAVLACLAACFTAFAQGVDLDRDGLDDATRAAVAATQALDPFGTGPVHVINLGALGVTGNINSATWEFDESVPAVNGARGYLWVGVSSPDKVIYKIDTLTPAVVASHQLSISPEGLGWDGRYLLVGSGTAIHQVDALTGSIVSTVPALPHYSTHYGVCWKPGLVPTPDQYMWSTSYWYTDHFYQPKANQLQHFTGRLNFSFPVNYAAIGSLTDGKTLWTSDYLVGTYRQWDMATGAPLAILPVSSVNDNPRDGTWDGHHLWDVTWYNGGFAWQWDLYPETGLYPVTVNLRPKAIRASPGGLLVVGIGLKNHSQTVWNARIVIDIFDSSNAPVSDALIKKTLQPGEVNDFSWTTPVPPGWSSGDTFKVRARLLAPTEESRAEDWTVIRVL